VSDINFDWRAECAAQAKYWRGACECRMDENTEEWTQLCDYHRDRDERTRALEAALRDLLDDLSEDVGQRHHRDKYRVYQVGPQVIEAAMKALHPLVTVPETPKVCATCGRPRGNDYPSCNDARHSQTALAESESSNRAHVAELKIADAKIDALMLEYCPDEMTQEQRDNWANNQASQTETKRKCPECVYDVSNPFVCDRCGTPMGPTVAETKGESGG
jgi:hypothetical protein